MAELTNEEKREIIKISELDAFLTLLVRGRFQQFSSEEVSHTILTSYMATMKQMLSDNFVNQVYKVNLMKDRNERFHICIDLLRDQLDHTTDDKDFKAFVLAKFIADING